MKELPKQTTFDHNHICWKCELVTNLGSWDYCTKCEEPHFICECCSPEYFTEPKEIPEIKEYPKLQKYSFKEKKELK